MLNQIVGQDRIKKRIAISIKASKIKNIPFAHTLFIGPPGYGKTLFATAIAEELEVEPTILNGAGVDSYKTLAGEILRQDEKSILFLDEIHSCPKKAQEALYHVMEKSIITIPGHITFQLPLFTILGATTDENLVNKPLRDRFKFVEYLKHYTEEDMEKIIRFGTDRLDTEAITTLAKRVKFNPRICNHILSFISDYCVAYNIGQVNKKVLEKVLELKDIDLAGLNSQDRLYIKHLGKDPQGLDTLAFKTGIPKATIEQDIEPYLLRMGFIAKTPRGRLLV